MSQSTSVLPSVDTHLITDRAPPPPYSETDPSDTFSDPGRGASNNRVLTPLSSSTNVASVAPGASQSTASSVEETIYTPPPSSADSVFQDRAPVDFHHVSASAAAFFESRHMTTTIISPPTIVKIAVDLDTQNLPYSRQILLPRDVTDQDWATFVNYLLPDHAFQVNNDVADRKLMDERMHLITLTDDNTTNDISQLDAQLKPLRQHQPQLVHHHERKRQLDIVISEWNDGFFGPRGLQVQMEFMQRDFADADDAQEPEDQQPRHIPGAWIPYDHELLGESSTSRSRKGFFSGFKGFQANSPNGFRMGPIVADNEGFRIGKAGLIADGSGFRVGNMIVADQYGIRLGGSRGFVADGNGVSMGGKSFGRREHRDTEVGRGQRENWRHRGQSYPRRRTRSRSSSISSSSSALSLDSEESDSSIGSIQDYDDLEDQQLLVAKQALTQWLNLADQDITRNYVTNMRREIADATGGTLRHTAPNLAVLRREVKELMKEFKESKKDQRKRRKQAKRQQRTRRRAERTERRNAKREARKLRRDGKSTKKMIESRQPTFTTSSSTCELSQVNFEAPRKPPRPAAAASTRLPFARTASVPYLGCNQSNNFRDVDSTRSEGLPGMSAMHGGWPYTRGMSYSPGNLSEPHLPPGAFPKPVSEGSGQLLFQAKEMAGIASSKEDRAIKVRTDATDWRVDETERLKKLNEATTLEEEAEQARMEADRLRAEALFLDNELAKELEDQYGQTTGIVQN